MRKMRPLPQELFINIKIFVRSGMVRPNGSGSITESGSTPQWWSSFAGTRLVVGGTVIYQYCDQYFWGFSLRCLAIE